MVDSSVAAVMSSVCSFPASEVVGDLLLSHQLSVLLATERGYLRLCPVPTHVSMRLSGSMALRDIALPLYIRCMRRCFIHIHCSVQTFHRCASDGLSVMCGQTRCYRSGF